MSSQNQFVDIILPVPLPRLFTYSIPEDMVSMVEVGKRVVVSFGKKKSYSGIVFKLHNNKPKEYETKPILSVLDSAPIVNNEQLRFWQWLADYYQCTLGEVYKAALPSGLKMESETNVIYNAEFVADHPLSPNEDKILDIVSAKKVCTINELNQLSGLKNCLPVLKRLLEYNALFVNEKLKEGFKAKTEKVLSLCDEYKNDESMHAAFDNLSRAPKQLELLMAFLSMCGGVNKANEGVFVSRQDLLKKNNASSSTLKELITKNIVCESERNIDRLDLTEKEKHEAHPLNEAQQDAHQQIQNAFATKDVCLLHGVTSGGKTEIYIHLIEEQLKKGKQVLYLLPEIALTTQITTRLKKHFGNLLGIYHSKFADAERVEVWNNLLEQKTYKVILGVRSSIFLPFQNLGLIVVDEEHENTYKQFDPAPRYHARDAAIVLANIFGAKTLLGTATPSIESYFNAQQGKYALIELTQRFEGIQMPEIIAVDTREARRKKKMNSHFSPVLLQHMDEALANGEQVILFQNRRGFSPFIECGQCAWVAKCVNCDVSMTYHKHFNQLVCHYCNHTEKLPDVCPACHSPAIETRGFGTEKIQEEMSILYPDYKVARMDLDTTRSKSAYDKIISKFEEGKVQILIGTQMISKGLDFENVRVVGILNADNMLNYPDFRAFERSFQLMTQVSGRAGRKHKRGLVILQTSNPQHPVIMDVINHNFANHYQGQIEERRAFKYPPFHRLIYITIKHKDQQITNQAAYFIAKQLTTVLGNRVLGPQAPVINRIQNQFIKKVLIKVEKKASPVKVKQLIQEVIFSLQSQQAYRYVTFQIDVDPA
ncbi:replication restart helicase PriA [Carboxylicivirga linearis]|uniref:Replication restart protein PriA n=1 Tax=Carboxylicivirga linearis TaxID=1628157 RepID=A0ABS5JP67_9BACT|nr:primosomal protein N' [Carboxylicivirga linearis]MBS2096653.1 primosomal protein N' [Carboxylicivirga linearis]